MAEAVDLYGGANTGLSSPYTHSAAVSPNDSVDLAYVTRALNITVSGTVKVTMKDGTTPTLTVPIGNIGIRVSRVWSNGTTATGITALW